jgi:hypothetical protein
MELAIAIARKKNSISSCMCLSTFIFSNMEANEKKIIDRLLRSGESYKIRFGFVTALLDNLTLQQVIFDNSCKGGHVDVQYKYQKTFPDLDFGNSQDQNTQDVIETARKCGGVCSQFAQTGKCVRGSNCRFSHKKGGKSKKKRRRQRKKITKKRR